jgi:hypothetical protein
MAKRCRSYCTATPCPGIGVSVLVNGCNAKRAGPGTTAVLKLGSTVIGGDVTSNRVALIAVTNAGTGYVTTPAVGVSGGGGSGCTAFANLSTVGVASTTLVSGGSGYVTAPSVTLSGGGGSSATATAQLTPGPVASVTLVSGSGYTPGTGYALGFTGGGGTGASGTFDVDSGGKVYHLQLTAGGSGYTSAPTLDFNVAGFGSGATATASVTSGAVTALVLGSGSGYTPGTGYALGIGGGAGGTGAAGTFDVNASGAVVNPQITAGGSGYFTAPAITFPGAGGSGASATSGVSPTSVASVTRQAAGGGYSSAPVVAISSPPSGTTATATATLNTRTVASIIVTHPGANYTSAPTVTIDPPPSGTTAVGTPQMGVFLWWAVASAGTYVATVTANAAETWWSTTPITSPNIVVATCTAGGSATVTLVPTAGNTCACAVCADALPDTCTVTDDNGTYTATRSGSSWSCCYTIPGQTVYTPNTIVVPCVTPTFTGSTAVGYSISCAAAPGGTKFRITQFWSICGGSPPFTQFLEGHCVGDVAYDPFQQAHTVNLNIDATDATAPAHCRDSVTWTLANGPANNVAVSWP